MVCFGAPLSCVCACEQVIGAACAPAAQTALLPALMGVQAAGGSSLSCAQWSAVASADAACLPAVRGSMLALVANASVVPSVYQPALTAQVTSLLSNPCASPPPPATAALSSTPPPPSTAVEPPIAPSISPPPVGPDSPAAGLASAALTLANVSLSTFSIDVLNRQLQASLPAGITAVAVVEDFVIQATGVLSATSALYTPAVAAVFVAGLASSLGVDVAQLSLGSMYTTTRRRLLAPLLHLPFKVSSLGTDPAIASNVLASISAMASPISPLSVALAQAGVGALSLAEAPTTSVVTSLRFTAPSAGMASAAAAALAAALPAVLPSAVMSIVSMPPAAAQTPTVTPSSAVIQYNEAGVDADALAALYTSALAVQCAHITTSGVMEAVTTMLGANLSCVRAVTSSAPTLAAPVQPTVTQARAPLLQPALPASLRHFIRLA
jgi:hypothetical protein